MRDIYEQDYHWAPSTPPDSRQKEFKYETKPKRVNKKAEKTISLQFSKHQYEKIRKMFPKGTEKVNQEKLKAFFLKVLAAYELIR